MKDIKFIGCGCDMSFNKDQLRDLIIRVLKKVDNFYSEDAVTLLMMTAASESDLGTYLHQVKGPAKGLMQVEPATMRDNYGSYLHFRDKLKEQIFSACHVGMPDVDALEYNIALNILMARVKYYRAPGPIPSTLEGMAMYHEEFYNAGGAAHWEITLEKYQKFCL